MATDNDLKESENKVESEEEKNIQNKDGKSNSAENLNGLEIILIIILLTVWSIFCALLKALQILPSIRYDSTEEFFEMAPNTARISTFFGYVIPIIWIAVPLIVVIYITLKNSKKD